MHAAYNIIFTQGLPDVEGSSHAHDVIPVKSALKYFEKRGWQPNVAGDILNNIKPSAFQYEYLGSSKEVAANRAVFGEAVNLVLDNLSKEEASKKVLVVDSKFGTRSGARDYFLPSSTGDLEGSTGLKVIHQKHPEVFLPSGIIERSNFSAAAGKSWFPTR